MNLETDDSSEFIDLFFAEFYRNKLRCNSNIWIIVIFEISYVASEFRYLVMNTRILVEKIQFSLDIQSKHSALDIFGTKSARYFIMHGSFPTLCCYLKDVTAPKVNQSVGMVPNKVSLLLHQSPSFCCTCHCR